MTLAGEPFRPNGASSLEQLAAVGHETGIAGLDAADPETVVLDEWIRVERLEAPKAVSFPGDDHGRYLVSIDYWSPVPDDQESVEKAVRYYGEYRMAWTQAPGDQWVAVSFDAFWPPERDSADLIIPIGACDSRCPA
ncbi:MAG: hypothetical protein SYR96_36630 [Actinomycetota bacterium]|nr:hypothetical protein [Actinomycetota bacterium]